MSDYATPVTLPGKRELALAGLRALRLGAPAGVSYGPLRSRPGEKHAQRAAVSAHWSAELRAKVAASAAAARERERLRVVVDLDDE